jgi:predicted phage tail component-like protein
MADYFTLGGVKSTEMGIVDVTHIIRPIYSGSREYLQYIAGMDGAHYHGEDQKDSIFWVRGYVDADSRSELVEKERALRTWLKNKELRSLIFSEEPDKRYMAKITGEVFQDPVGLLMFMEIPFIVPSGYAEAVTAKTGVNVFPATNAGSLPCPCLITCTMATDTPSLKITLTETGEYIHLYRPLAAGDEIYIDTGQRFVAVNGGDARDDVTYLSTYFWLPPGEFTLTADPATTISAEYRERWA